MQLIKRKSVTLSANLDENKIRTTRRGTLMLAQGFTLVEIIIVLAIVGLIFVIIFLAVGAAQRGHRDTARKDNVNRTIATIQQQLGNGQTVTPPATGSGTSLVVGSGTVTLNPPITGWANNLTSVGTTAALRATIGWALSGTGCTGVTGSPTGNGGSTGAVYVNLEGGSTYCKDY